VSLESAARVCCQQETCKRCRFTFPGLSACLRDCSPGGQGCLPEGKGYLPETVTRRPSGFQSLCDICAQIQTKRLIPSKASRWMCELPLTVWTLICTQMSYSTAFGHWRSTQVKLLIGYLDKVCTFIFFAWDLHKLPLTIWIIVPLGAWMQRCLSTFVGPTVSMYVEIHVGYLDVEKPFLAAVLKHPLAIWKIVCLRAGRKRLISTFPENEVANNG